MLGTLVNAGAIVLGMVLGRLARQPWAMENQLFLKLLLGIAAAAAGLRLCWVNLWADGFRDGLWQLALVLLAMILGKFTGRLLGLQSFSNRLGRFARERMAAVPAGRTPPPSEGLNVGAALFCAAPLGLYGAVAEGVAGGWLLVAALPLLVKAAMDGLAAFGFVRLFGWGIGLAALPVLAFQGTIFLLVAEFAAPWLAAHQLTASVNATLGLLVFCVALVIFEVKRIALADYLPSLVFAPLLTLWLLR
jgi:uncharacterized membrane protein YqgA involved in biofilm formation